MSLIVIPNVSEGRDPGVLDALREAVRRAGARVLDTHSDAVHNRSVFTIAGAAEELIGAMGSLAIEAAARIDLTIQEGVHPRLGALDVCPFVAHSTTMPEAVSAALETGRRIGHRLPVYLYGRAAPTQRPLELAELRRGGLAALIGRSKTFPPNLGPVDISPRAGVVCVGARRPLIAFNVWIECELAQARQIAAAVRASSGGIPGIRALGVEMRAGLCQVSMNLVDPDTTGIEAAFTAVAEEARTKGVVPVGTEIVGLPPQRYMPSPDAKATRLLISPGRSLESELAKD